MVVMDFSEAALMGVTQLRAAAPSMCTVQAPQSPMPQPNFVPVREASSRRYQSRGISGSPSNWRAAPLTFRRIMRLTYHAVLAVKRSMDLYVLWPGGV